MNRTESYQELLLHFAKMKQLTLIDLFASQKNRLEELSLSYDGLYFDFSKNNITGETLDLLVNLAKEQGLEKQIEMMFSGEKINNTEGRSVLHTALRADINRDIVVNGKNIMLDIRSVLSRMKRFSQKLHSGEHRGYTGLAITDIVNIGIGGSDLGLVFACEALKPYRQMINAESESKSQNSLNIHFISSVDGYHLYDTLAELNPETTLFVIVSKTFTTQETITNALSVKDWFLQYAKDEIHIKQHFVAVSTNTLAVTDFGIDEGNMFEFWDFVGGRYSIWSAVGLSIILYIGYENFAQMLDGARAMDQHFYKNKNNLRQNLPVVLALIGVWYRNFYNYPTLVISPYNTRLSKLPFYLQQLEMESNGKSIQKNGDQITNYDTCPIVWGGNGINGQHAYYQLLHQGTLINPMDIIIATSCKFTNKKHNDILVANAFAQAEAFMCGKNYSVAKNELLVSGMDETMASSLAKHKVFLGNRPTNTVLLPEINPYYLGMLIALYEHKTFVQGVIWGINSFDQMGVELGKQLANNILSDIKKIDNYQSLAKNSEVLGGFCADHDVSTSKLIEKYLE